jgi:hypothetical protein
MFEKPSAAMMIALRDFVFRHEIFVEAASSTMASSSRDNRGGGRRESVRDATSKYFFAVTNGVSVSSV